MAPAPDGATRLRDAGLRVTRPRLAVLQVLAEAPPEQRHLLVAEVCRSAEALLGRLSKQAVYDCLDALTAARLVRRLDVAGSQARYELRAGDNHHHLVCRDCGRAVDVDCRLGSAPCLHPVDDAGFAVDEAEITYWGRCPDCRSA